MLPHLPVPAVMLGWSLAAVLGGGVLVILLRRAGYSSSQTTIALVTLIAAVALGSKALYLVEAWPRWLRDVGMVKPEPREPQPHRALRDHDRRDLMI
jgi:peptidoglycan biosynthesis protein MviN/MurJ (putative lipid II flippase)